MMYAWLLLRECIPVLQICFKFNAGYFLMPCYSPATRSSFVRLPDEFYVTNFDVAVSSDGSRKYAVGYSLFCSCFLATWCLRQVAVLLMRPQILTLLPVMHDLLPIFYFFNYFEFIFQFWRSASFCGSACCHLGGEDFGHQPERNFGKTNSLILRVKCSFVC